MGNSAEWIVERPTINGSVASLTDTKAVYFDGATYRLYYQGWNGTYLQTGLATSADGIHWLKNPASPVLPHGDAGSWDDAGAQADGIFVHDGTSYMFYTGGALGGTRAEMGVATSTEGRTPVASRN